MIEIIVIDSNVYLRILPLCLISNLKHVLRITRSHPSSSIKGLLNENFQLNKHGIKLIIKKSVFKYHPQRIF